MLEEKILLTFWCKYASEKDYKEKNMKLDTKKKKEIKKIVKEFNDRPDDLAKTLAEKFGLEYVE